MKRLLSSVLILLSVGSASGGPDDSSCVVTTACDLARAVVDESNVLTRFHLKAHCTRADGNTIFFEDAGGAMSANCEEAVFTPDGSHPSDGDTLQLTGAVAAFCSHLRAKCSKVEVLERGRPRPPAPVSGTDFVSGRFDYRLVTIQGTVNDIVTDEVDSSFRFLHLLCDGERILVPLRGNTGAFAVGTTVSASGICSPTPFMSRRQIGRMLYYCRPDDIQVTRQPLSSPFDAPLLKPFYRLQPEALSKLPRHKVVGCVRALWNGSQALVAAEGGFLVKVTFSSPELPSVGETVEVVGLPETDLYRVNLSHALWRTHPALPAATNAPPVALCARDIVRTDRGRIVYDSLLDGRTVRLEGVIRQLPSGIGSDTRLYLDDSAQLVPVDLTSAPDAVRDIAVGSRLEVTGVCLLETETWQPNLAFPKVTGFTIAVRSANDLRLRARPPFWTVRRLGAVIAALASLLLAILLWNRSLRLLANRRGLQLFREKVTTLKANLRVDERTKLAVELHDSLAQSLTGVYMEIETAGEFADGARPELLAHLQTAAATVKSCHGELRNCLWDLRNMALEERNMDAAIRRTLAPHVRNVALAVRFAVPRARLTDNVAHAVLRIVRELTINAVHHGGAKSVKVAGGIDGDILRFSVRDDGRGFDPDACPGVLQGHFGLEGIRERAGLLGGSLDIASERGRGTKAVVTIHLPKAEDTRKELA